MISGNNSSAGRIFIESGGLRKGKNMRSEDWIQGPVLHVLAADTFEMQVTLIGRHNDFPYNARERIRVSGSAPSFNTFTGQEAKTQLEAWLLGKSVRCFVLARDLEGVLFCEVEIVSG